MADSSIMFNFANVCLIRDCVSAFETARPIRTSSKSTPKQLMQQPGGETTHHKTFAWLPVANFDAKTRVRSPTNIFMNYRNLHCSRYPERRSHNQYSSQLWKLEPTLECAACAPRRD